jgi:hypothetical protein
VSGPLPTYAQTRGGPDTQVMFKGAMSQIFDLKCLLFKNSTTKLKINIVNGLSYDIRVISIKQL